MVRFQTQTGDGGQVFLSFEGRIPAVGHRVYVDDSARVIGLVELGDDAVVLPGAVIRGDYDSIRIGASSVVEDGCVLHADEGGLVIGERVVIGHGAVVHGAAIGNGVLIGMGATVLARSVIGEGSLIAAGALVPEGMEIPPGSLAMGVPARVVRPVSDEQREYIAFAGEYYRGWGERCRAGAMQPVEPRGLDL